MSPKCGATGLAALTAALALSACTDSARSTPAAPTFTSAASHPDCMPHQAGTPSRAEQSGADVARALTVLRYYTSRGSQPFCDGRPATAADVAWMKLYVAQGADRSHVARWLSGP